MKIITTDNNEYLPDGSPNPNYGHTTEVDMPDPLKKDELLSVGPFKSYCYAQLGGGQAGATRFGQIILAAKNTTDGGVYAAYDQYVSADTYDKANVTIFAQLLVTGGIMTANEAAAIINNWPMA